MEIYWCNVQPYSSYYGIVFLLFLCLIIKKLRLTDIDIWNCALKIFNAENCGSTLLIGDENNLSELADISVNILKLPTEDPTNPENMGMLVMLNGFGECMQKYFQLEQVAFNVSRHANFANLVNRIDWFSNQTVNQVRIDELIAAERALTTSELSDLAVSLGFQNTQALNDFGCNTETDINIIKGSITSVASEDEIVVLNSASKYYPDQTKIHVPSEVQGGNLGIAIGMGSCSGEQYPDDIIYTTGDDVWYCLKEAAGWNLAAPVFEVLSGEFGGYASIIAMAEAAGTEVTIRAGIKILSKVGLRYCGIIGVAVMVGDFAHCMKNR